MKDNLMPQSPATSTDDDGSWQTIFQGPAHDAGMFYNQIQDEIKSLRKRVDAKLSDIIAGGNEDIEDLNKQVLTLKSTASSDASEEAPAVERVERNLSKGGMRLGRVREKSILSEDDTSSFGDLRISASAATELATNLTRTVVSRKMKNYSYRVEEEDSTNFEWDDVVEEEDENEEEEEEEPEQEVVESKTQQSQKRLRPQRKQKNNPPPFSPNDAVAAARHATQDDAVTNARYGRASPPRRRFFPEESSVRKNGLEEGSAVSSTGPTQSSYSTLHDNEFREHAPRSDASAPLRRTPSEVHQSLSNHPVTSTLSPSPSKDAPEIDRDLAPDPVPTAAPLPRSFKYTQTANDASNNGDQFEIIVPSSQSEANNRSKRSSRSRTSGISYPSEVNISAKSRGKASDNRSESNVSTRSRVSGLSQSSEFNAPSKSRVGSDDPQADLLMASLEFLDESRRSLEHQRQQKSERDRVTRQTKSTNISVTGRSRMSDFSAAKSRTSEMSGISGTSELSSVSGLNAEEVGLLKASLAYLEGNGHLPESPTMTGLPEQRRWLGNDQPRRQIHTPPQYASDQEYHHGQQHQQYHHRRQQQQYHHRQQPKYHQQQQHYHLLPDHLQSIASRNGSFEYSDPIRSRLSSNELHEIQEDQWYDDRELYDSTDQSVSLQSYASKSIAAKSANLMSIASTSVTECLDVQSETFGDGKGLLAMIEKDLGTEGVVRVEKVQNHPVVDPYGDHGRYTGLLVKGKPYGHGSMHYDDGRSYTGEWKHARWNGKGRTLFVNGDFYVGEYVKDQRHGLGRYEWSDGRVYDGQFKRDRREGKGTYSWPDGAIYAGDFKNGHRHGQGCYRFKDGSVYTGEFKDGKYHGVGECVWADGRCYRGEWNEGHAHGYGIEMRPDGSSRHDGEWRKDRPIRKGVKKDRQAKVEKKKKGFKMPEDERSRRKRRPKPGGSPFHPVDSLSPRKTNYFAIDP